MTDMQSTILQNDTILSSYFRKYRLFHLMLTPALIITFYVRMFSLLLSVLSLFL